jgi:hypothetical protein
MPSRFKTLIAALALIVSVLAVGHRLYGGHHGPRLAGSPVIGEPVQVIHGPVTGLPIPAHAEIAYEGFISPDDRIDEGPLGEWTGYYCSGKSPQPVIRVESMLLGEGEASTPSIASEFSTPLIDPDPAGVAKWYRVDPSLCIWRNGGWAPLNAQDAPPEPASAESTPADATPTDAPAPK